MWTASPDGRRLWKSTRLVVVIHAASLSRCTWGRALPCKHPTLHSRPNLGFAVTPLAQVATCTAAFKYEDGTRPVFEVPYDVLVCAGE
jgi:hypothetical protein